MLSESFINLHNITKRINPLTVHRQLMGKWCKFVGEMVHIWLRMSYAYLRHWQCATQIRQWSLSKWSCRTLQLSKLVDLSAHAQGKSGIDGKGSALILCRRNSQYRVCCSVFLWDSFHINCRSTGEPVKPKHRWRLWRVWRECMKCVSTQPVRRQDWRLPD